MTSVVVLVGIFLALMGAVGLIAPRAWTAMSRLLTPELLFGATIARILVGSAFLFAASSTHAPMFVGTVGVLLIAAGLMIPVLGTTRVKRLVDTMLRTPELARRAIALLVIAFGYALVGTVA